MKYTRSKTALFLIELIVAILFFSITSALCVQLFARSQTLNRKTNAIDHFMIKVENCAEIYSAKNGDLKYVTDYLQILGEDEQFIVYYDKSLNQCSIDQVFYTLTGSVIKEENNIETLSLKVTDYNQETLFSLDQAVYRKK